MTWPLRQLSDAVRSDNSFNTMNIHIMYHAVARFARLESGIVKLSIFAKEQKRNGQPVLEVSNFCHLAKDKLGLTLRLYFNWYKSSKVERFKFLFVSYNIWLYNETGSRHLRNS